MRSLLVLLLVIFSINQNYAQEGTENLPSVPSFYVASPEAGKIGEFGDLPTNLSTGQINQDIPIYTIDEGIIQLPVSLSYQYSGLIVDEVPGSVGLGWQLNAGGMITRQVRGLPDEHFNGFIGANQIGLKVLEYANESITDDDKTTLLRNAAEGQWDTETDKYFVRIGNISATFYYRADGEIVFAPHKNYKITRIRNGFQLIDDRGIIYTFDKQEYADVETFNGSDSIIRTHITSWLVTKIKLPNSRMITYSYIPYGFGQRTYSDGYIEVDTDTSFNPGLCVSLMQRPYQFFTITNTFGFLLRQIQFSQGTVNFSYHMGTIPEENKNPATLDRVSVTNSIGQSVYQYDIEYNDLTSKRRLLTDIYQVAQEKRRTLYSFNYYPVPEDIAYYKQDHWGFYNGSNNTTGKLVPKNNNRGLDYPSTRAGALRKITYPTGGYTEIRYEQNTVAVDRVSIPNVGIETASNLLNREINIVLNADLSNEAIYEQKIVKEIQVDELVVSDGRSQQSASNFEFSYYMHSSKPYSLSSLEIIRIENTYDIPCGTCSYRNFASAEPNPGTTDPNDESLPGVTRTRDTAPIKLAPGRYRITGVIGRAGSVAEDFRTYPRAVLTLFARYYSKEEDPSGSPLPSVTNVPYGGLRVKSITSFDQNGSIELKRNFSYQEQNSTKSSGMNLAIPHYSFDESHKFTSTTQGRPPLVCDVNNILSSSAVPLSTYMGVPVLYTSVREQRNDSDQTIWHTFSGTPNLAVPDPFPKIDNENWKKGNVIERNHLNSRGKVLRNEFNRYSGRFLHSNTPAIDYSQNLKSRQKFFFYGPTGLQQFTKNGFFRYAAVGYSFRSENFFLARRVVTDSLQDTKVSVLTSYTHEAEKGQLKHTDITNSDGQTVRTTYTYPYEEENHPLATTNRIAQPVQVKVNHANDETLSSLQKSKMVYKTTTGGLIVTDRTLQAKAESPYTTQVEYKRYDRRANPIEVLYKEHTWVTYLWGYNKSLLVAKIENAKLRDIAAALNVDIETVINYSEEDLSSIKSLREKLPQAQITTYEHIPLVGLKQQTDPRGYTIHYTYDNENRLQFIKDDRGNFVEEHQYNYKN